MSTNKNGVLYGDYLQLEKLLSCVRLESASSGQAAHEEHLFIIIHQTYELWFKQLLFELESILTIFSQPTVDERNMLLVINRFTRVIEILKILVDQIRILETMDPLDFMAFRNYLVPASGFQSLQFRKIEIILGLTSENRNKYQQQHYKSYFAEQQAKDLTDAEAKPSLLLLIEAWLERTPGLSLDGFIFANEYASAVARLVAEQESAVNKRDDLTEEEKSAALQGVEKTKELFHTIIDEEAYETLRKEGSRRISHKAMLGGLMIHLYRQEPRFHLPYQLLSKLTDIDALMTQWRYQHMQMVQRMIGSKVGTGGSSGYHYLRTTVSDRYKVFLDLCNIPTFLIPREFTPHLPAKLLQSLNFS